MKTNNFQQLKTTDDKLENIPLSEYPRPQLVRDSYVNLNGEWEFGISSDKNCIPNFDKKIIVPYCIESYLSKINYRYPTTTYYFYKKEITLDKSFIKDKVLLHFDGVDQECDVFVNSIKVGENKGGYIPFTCEIKDALNIEGTNTITVIVKDTLNHDYPWGKQRIDRKGMWYTPVSGIWKSVWLESVSSDYIKSIKIETTLEEVKIKIDSEATSKKITIHTPNNDIIRRTKENEIVVKIPSPICWDVDNPYLYNFDIETPNDKVSSYFGLRTFSIKKKNGYPYFFLNDKPVFIHGLLDQGYYPDGIYTPHSYNEYEKDILRMKELGFNTLRKHIKIEPLYFYYLCDKHGMLIIQDFVNNGGYNFIRDTALPTIRIYFPEWTLFKSKKADKIFYDQMKKTVDLLYNSTSLFMYTIYNEAWGQKNPDKAYKVLKELDSTRLIDSTSGWFKRKESDFTSLHIYFREISFKPSDKPIFISEFGGFGYKLNEHSFNPDNTYGYGLFTNQEDYQNAVNSLYFNQVIPNIKNGLMGTIYTQVSDVEDETNGLLTYDRKVCKVNKEDMLKIKEQLKI